MLVKNVPLSQLKEHPKNKEYFQDISGEFWRIFIEDIRENGIREPLTVNSLNMRVIKGNQRLRAALEIGLSEVPCFMVSLDNEEIEVEELIRDNVLRRDIDVFTKFMLVNKLRESVKGRIAGRPASKGVENNPAENRQDLPPRDKIAEILNVSKDVISMADLFNALPQEKQTEMREWFYSHEAEPTQKEFKQELDRLAGKTRELEASLRESYDRNAKIVGEVDKLYSERVKLNTDIADKNQEIDRLNRTLAKVEGDKAQVELLRKNIEDLKTRRDTFQSELNEITKLVKVKHDARRLIDTLSPVKYTELFQRNGISPVARETVVEILDLVQGWVNDVQAALDSLETTIKVV